MCILELVSDNITALNYKVTNHPPLRRTFLLLQVLSCLEECPPACPPQKRPEAIKASFSLYTPVFTPPELWRHGQLPSLPGPQAASGPPFR
ncbi:hypothetical protein AVEN_26329-1 [Araneus ventricosus]|uniref:Uncharacterized protein n=1 Tax=Araneus ventricosus TaxID=182803 RepID=A0A4Y2AM06_ARAVE|nr:hypothetical protein AVEN_26329-1 [Araneus ventricosus]